MSRLVLKDYLLFAEAWSLLALARVILVFLPFKKIVPLMRYKNIGKTPPLEREVILGNIQLAIARACIRSPWRTKCFEQALAGKMMTRRRGINSVIYFGVAKDNEAMKLKAHAWLNCDGLVITGRNQLAKYKVVGKF